MRSRFRLWLDQEFSISCFSGSSCWKELVCFGLLSCCMVQFCCSFNFYVNNLPHAPYDIWEISGDILWWSDQLRCSHNGDMPVCGYKCKIVLSFYYVLWKKKIFHFSFLLDISVSICSPPVCASCSGVWVRVWMPLWRSRPRGRWL